MRLAPVLRVIGHCGGAMVKTLAGPLFRRAHHHQRAGPMAALRGRSAVTFLLYAPRTSTAYRARARPFNAIYAGCTARGRGMNPARADGPATRGSARSARARGAGRPCRTRCSSTIRTCSRREVRRGEPFLRRGDRCSRARGTDPGRGPHGPPDARPAPTLRHAARGSRRRHRGQRGQAAWWTCAPHRRGAPGPTPLRLDVTDPESRSRRAIRCARARGRDPAHGGRRSAGRSAGRSTTS